MVRENPLSELHAAVETLLAARTPRYAPSPELARVRAARSVRDELLEAAESVVDDAIDQARIRTPTGHTHAEIGDALGMSGQAVGQRVRQRGLVAERVRPPAEPRADRQRRQRAEQAASIRASHRWIGQPLQRLTDSDGHVAGYRPVDADDGVGTEWVQPRPPRPRERDDTSSTTRPNTTPPPRRTRHFASARERAHAAAGGTVFRPEMLRYDPPPEQS